MTCENAYMRLHSCLIGLALTTGGCGRQSVQFAAPVLYLCPDVAPGLQDAVTKLISTSGGALVYGSTEEGCIHVVEGRHPERPDAEGTWDPDTRTVRVSDDYWSPDGQALILAHELGHAAGYGHLEAPSLMQAAIAGLEEHTCYGAAGECLAEVLSSPPGQNSP